jgi:hypothetical protein
MVQSNNKMNTTTGNLFDEYGRRLPFEGMRAFNRVSRRYYQLNQPDIRFDTVLRRIIKHAGVAETISAQQFESACLDLMKTAKEDVFIRDICKGVHVPFVYPKYVNDVDLGEEFEQHWLAAVQSSFTAMFPQYHFKSTLQGEASSLRGTLTLAEGARYENFLRARRQGVIVGWYFPTALQEYDTASQRGQMRTLPLPETLVLSGGFDAAAALVGSPDLLMNRETYPPVLCLSAFEHTDKRLMLCFKAYGLSLEFWLLSQMLVPGITQVSEQWAGGLTLFTVI